MSTISATNTASTALAGRAVPRPGLLRRFLDAIVASRSREAERRIAVHLATMSDQRLADLAFSAAEIKSIRAGESIGNILARRAAKFG